MENVIKYLELYGLPILIMGLIIIVLVGIIKACGLKKCLENRPVLRKVIYYTLDIALSFGVVALYFYIFEKNFAQYLVYTGAQITVTTTLYAIYENFGARALQQKIVGLLGVAIKNSKNKKFLKIVEQLGIDNVLQEIQKLVTKAEAVAQENTNEQTRS